MIVCLTVLTNSISTSNCSNQICFSVFLLSTLCCHILMSVWVCMHVCMQVCSQESMHVCMFICMSVCLSVCLVFCLSKDTCFPDVAGDQSIKMDDMRLKCQLLFCEGEGNCRRSSLIVPVRDHSSLIASVMDPLFCCNYCYWSCMFDNHASFVEWPPVSGGLLISKSLCRWCSSLWKAYIQNLSWFSSASGGDLINLKDGLMPDNTSILFLDEEFNDIVWQQKPLTSAEMTLSRVLTVRLE